MTIKEIARLAGVSVGTVHSALYDKPTVSEKTKEKVLRVAKEYHYQVNTAAAALKRKLKKVAVVIPTLTSENRYYFNHFWKALNDYKSTIHDFNISFEEIPYELGDQALAERLQALYEAEEISGMICFSAYLEEKAKAVLRALSEKGLPVVLAGETDASGTALCSICPDYEIAGRMVGELLFRQIPEESKILVCAGQASISSHYEVVEGIGRYFAEKGLEDPLLLMHYSKDVRRCYEALIAALQKEPSIGACFAVTARESVLLGRALSETGRAGEVLAIGSDLFQENMDFLQEGIFTNLLNKNPYTQMHRALETMVNFLARGKKPLHQELYVGTEIVFQSSLPMYQQGEIDRLLL